MKEEYLPIIRKEVEAAVKDFQEKNANQILTEEQLKKIIIEVVKDEEVAEALADSIRKSIFKKK